MDDQLLVQRDHVIEHMIEHLGGKVEHVTRPFNPMGGAYRHGRTHSHEHGASAHVHTHLRSDFNGHAMAITGFSDW